MHELIGRSLRLWRKARKPEATRAELLEALAAIPELCSALGASRLDEAEVGRLGRHLAHEVRNRLNLVESSLEKAARLSGDDRVREALEPIRGTLANLVAVADDLSAGALTSQGNGAAARAPLRSVIEGVLAASRDLAEARGIRVEADGDLPDVEVDTGRLELVLINLLTNALRHGDAGKPYRYVRLECRPAGDGDGDGWRIGVRDNGVGIPEELRDRLFQEPEPDGDGAPPRSGMGLAIVRQAVERTGGRVWIESREGLGTAVYFTIPKGGEPADEASGVAYPTAGAR